MDSTIEWVATSDGLHLHAEITGKGAPILFVHEFGGDQRSWEPQVRFFSERYQCITFNARGYPPSSVPEDPAKYSQARAVDDIVDVMNHIGIERSHIIGLSMGGFAALHFGLQHPDRAVSLVAASTGFGAEKKYDAYFKQVSHEIADLYEKYGAEEFSHIYAQSAPRIPFLVKDPHGWEEFRRVLGDRSALGAALTMRGVQAARPSIYEFEDGLKSMNLPTLIIAGDEDDNCLQPGLFLKSAIPASGLMIIPKTGHTCNLEEPDLFNQIVSEFLTAVEVERWLPRDPRCVPLEILKENT